MQTPHLPTSSESWSIPAQLSTLPRIEWLREFLETLQSERRQDVSFVVLYGSMARGDWSRNSDFDVIVGLARDGGERFLDRVGDYGALAPGRVEPLPYYPAEWERKFCSLSGLALDALKDGVPLVDVHRRWASYRRRFEELLESGCLERLPHGWRWSPDARERAHASLLTGPVGAEAILDDLIGTWVDDPEFDAALQTQDRADLEP